MREYPRDINELENKYGILLSDRECFFEEVNSNIIFRHDLAYVFLKERLFKTSLNQLINEKDGLYKQKIDIIEKKKNRKVIWNEIRDIIPFYIGELEKSIKYFFLLLIIFLLPWVCALALYDNTIFVFVIIHPFVLGLLISISSLLVFGVDILIGGFFKKHQIPSEFRGLLIHDFIGKLINNNRDLIKKEFDKIFESDLDEMKYKSKITTHNTSV